jgi:hypothetical protein
MSGPNATTPGFDPATASFDGKLIADMSREELRQALIETLVILHRQSSSGLFPVYGSTENDD